MQEQPFPVGSATRKPKFTVRDQGERLNVLGDRQFVMLTGEDTEGRFTLIENENAPGVGPPLHIHRNEDEAFYVLEGRVEFQVDENAMVGEAGTTVFLPRDSVHSWRVIGDEPARMLIMLMPAGLEGYFRALSDLGGEESSGMDEVLAISARYGIEFPEL